VLGLFKFSNVSDESFVLLIFSLTKDHSSTSHVFLLSVRSFLLQLVQLDAVVLVLFVVFIPLFSEVYEHFVVHVHVSHLIR